MASHCNQEDCGFSIYHGILVQWDEDQDLRVLEFIDDMEEDARNGLLVIQEHEGCLGFIWKHIPHYKERESLETMSGDVWTVVQSTYCPL